MATDLCSVCGRPLRDGLCPEGHPQRAARSGRRRRRISRPVAILVVVVLLLAVGGYFALVWYPVRAAGSAMRPTSAEYTQAVEAYTAAVEAYPQPGDPEALETVARVLEQTDTARSSLSEARITLEERDLVSLPLISGRPALETAERARDRMLEFYAGAQELIGELEASARYLTELQGVLSSLQNLRAALSVPRSPAEVANVVAAARPIAEQLQADTRALSPPDSLLEVHASLLAIGGRIRTDIDELERAAGEGGITPVLAALVEGIRSQIGTYAETAVSAPEAAREAGLDEQIERLTELTHRINDLLLELDEQGVDGLSIPGAV